MSNQQPFEGAVPPRPPEETGEDIPPCPPASSTLFNSIRRSGWYRAQDRALAGVCSGISARTGVSLALVRAVVFVLMFFAPPTVIVYALAWLLLPEETDGRIHLESLLRGDLDIAQIGAFGLMLFVPLNPFSWLAGGITGFVRYLLNSIAVCMFLLGMVVIIGSTKKRSFTRASRTSYVRATPFPSAGPSVPPSTNTMPSTEGASAFPSAGGEQTSDKFVNTGYPETPVAVPKPTAYSQPEAQPRHVAAPNTPGLSRPAAPSPHIRPIPPASWYVPRAVNLIITGLVLIVIALGLFIGYQNLQFDGREKDVMRIFLIAGAICFLIVGVTMLVASLRGRNAGFLVGLSVIGLLLAPFPIFGLIATSIGETSENSTSYSAPPPEDTDTAYYGWKDDKVTFTGGPADVNLSSAPVGTEKWITFQGHADDLTVTVRKDQPVSIRWDAPRGKVEPEYQSRSNSPADPWIEANEMDSPSTTGRSLHSGSWEGKGIVLNLAGPPRSLTIIEINAGQESDSEHSEQMSEEPSPTPSPSPPESGDGTTTSSATQMYLPASSSPLSVS